MVLADTRAVPNQRSKDYSKKEQRWSNIVDDFIENDMPGGRYYFEALRALSEQQIRNVMRKLPA